MIRTTSRMVKLILTGQILRFQQFLRISLLGRLAVMEPSLKELAKSFSKISELLTLELLVSNSVPSWTCMRAAEPKLRAV